MGTDTAIFGAGCFWGVEATLAKIDGVTRATSGYSGGATESPTYEQVCTGNTGHAEVVEVEYDPDRVTYDQLLDEFWRLHDPTTINRQGPDRGTQYRSAVFYRDESQRAAAEASKKGLGESGRFTDPIATEITEAGEFYRAEDYHQGYFEKRGIAYH